MSKQLNLFDDFNLFSYILFTDVFPESESDEIEYKSAEGGFPKDFWKTYSAFANTNGGIIVLGVKEKKNQFIIEGLSDEKIDIYQKEFWNNVNNKNTISNNLLSNEDVKKHNSQGKKVLIFRIPIASRTQKPVHLTTNPFQNTFKRNYEGDYKCTDEEVRRMLSDADLSFRPDSRILEGYTMEDLDTKSIVQYRQIFSSVRPTHNWLALTDKELLMQLGGYRIDRKTKKEGPTVAGVLMFGKTISITDEECCPRFFPDYRELLSESTNERWSDRIYPDGTWEANLFQFYRMVWPKLSSRLPKPFQLLKGQRQDETPAHIALREAFVNSLIHTDYSAPGNVIIESKPDTFKFTNPGTLLVTLSQYYAGGISECRNTSLQKMFLMIGSAEKAGSGVGKILSGWNYAHWRVPYLAMDTNPDRLILELPMFSILPEETLNELRVLFGETVDALGMDELTILAACHIEGEITNSRLQYMINKHKTDITKLLQDLCKASYLISENKSRWTTYHLNKDYANNMDTSSANMDTSSANMDTSSVNMDTSDSKSKKRVSKNILLEMILNYCSLEFKTAEEIAIHLGKTSKYLKNSVIPNLIIDEKLERLYPFIPNHPNQKYKAVKPKVE